MASRPIGRPPKRGSNSYNEYKRKTKLDLAALKDTIVLPSPEWKDVSPSSCEAISLCKITGCSVSYCITINSNGSWNVSVYGRNVVPGHCQMLSQIPCEVNHASGSRLLEIVHGSTICPGNNDEKYVAMIAERKGRNIVSPDGSVAAYLDETMEKMHTVRTSKCEVLLTTGDRCHACVSYRNNLRAMFHRRHNSISVSPSVHISTSSHTNVRYLNTPDKSKRYKLLKARCDAAEKKVKRLTENITKLIDTRSVPVDQGLHQDLLKIMEENEGSIANDFPEDSFQRLFWKQQQEAFKVKNDRQLRWHPMIVKWCLHLKMISSAAYHAMKSSGFIKLPSERTLRDYTHLVKAATGIQPEVNAQILKEAKVETLEEWKKYVVVVFDEVKIREDLVYDKHTSEVVGFLDLGEVNNQLNALSDVAIKGDFTPISVATHMLVYMVRSLFTSFEFPYAQFATRTASAAEITLMTWDVVRNLESCDLKVIALSCDGASTNRSFFKIYSSSKKGLCYKTKNPYANEDRQIYFVSDVPHLMKTVRNCWSHSFAHGGHRPMWINGKHISWEHLCDLYKKCQNKTGLTFLKKIKWEHLVLTSYSRMRVDLAVQVLSSTVASAFAHFGDPATFETERFVRMFDKFFDCLNVRSFTECTEKRKPDVRPYRSKDDPRFDWLKDCFLGYLNEWQQSVAARTDFKKAQKQMMTLSRETLDGLRITGVNSFVEVGQYLLTLEGVKCLLSEKFCQDPVEAFFGKQRACGGRNDNPTVKQFLDNTVSLRLQGSVALDPIRGNCRKRKREEMKVDETPLPKRKRNRKKT